MKRPKSSSLDPLLTENYNFKLPDNLIAKEPASPKDSAKLMVYNRATKEITHSNFSEIENFLPDDCAILFNNTKVIKARLFGTKNTGGKVELLINRPLEENLIEVFIRGKVHEGTRLNFDNNLEAEVVYLHENGARDVLFFENRMTIDFERLTEVLENIGHIPLPPYIDREDKQSDTQNYQSVFAKHSGAVAAPTASLHFTKELFESVTSTHRHEYITLHVGAGTFKPVESKIITEHPMHSESYYIDENAKALVESSQKLLAVGTTVTRTIEYYVRYKKSYGEANLFLHLQNRPQRVNYLLTNFHLPKSTLLMLVSSFVGLDEMHRLYSEAIKEKYRFYSYGDAMLIL